MKHDPYRGSVPTRPKQAAVAEPRERVTDDDEPTLVRCPTCIGLGAITAEQYAALEAEAKRRDQQR